MLTIDKETANKSVLYRDFGLYAKNEKEQFYKIKKVYIFSNDKIYMIDNHFYDNIKNDYLIINGETPRKNKIDLSLKTNFIVKAEQEIYDFEIMYNLYINADLNKYNFDRLDLNGDMFNIYYKLNDNIYNHCIGWNNKKSNAIKYSEDVQNIYKYINYFSNSEEYKNKLKEYTKKYNQYIKALEKEKQYNVNDYKYFNLASGTTEEENKTILKNNGFNI